VAAEPLGAITGAKKWCRLNDCDIPPAEQFELMRRCAPRKPTTDD
jgi:hypothetical protein